MSEVWFAVYGGCAKTVPNADLSHIFVEPKKMNVERMKLLQEKICGLKSSASDKIVFLDRKYITDCINRKILLDETGYMIDL